MNRCLHNDPKGCYEPGDGGVLSDNDGALEPEFADPRLYDRFPKPK